MIETPKDDDEFPLYEPEKVEIPDFPELAPDDDEDFESIDIDDEDLDPPGDNAKVEGDEP
jgi:hypothetical protein